MARRTSDVRRVGRSGAFVPSACSTAVRAALVVGLVLLAGCSGIAGVADGPTDETPTLSPAPVAEPTPSTTPPPTAQPSLAPGIGPEGVRDPFTVSSAHTFTLTNTSFRFTDRLTVRNVSGELRYHRNVTVTVEGSEFLRQDRISGPRAVAVRQPPGAFDLYSDGTQFRGRFVTDDGTSYTQSDGSSYIQQREKYNPPPHQGRLFAVFSIPERWTVRTDPLRLTGGSPRTNPGPLGPGVDARQLTVTATFDDGVVTRWTVHYATQVDGETVIVTRRVRYFDVGETTVSRPAWYDAASE